MSFPRLRASLLLLSFPLSSRCVAPAQQTGWPVYNGGIDGDHYSTLTQITRRNVHLLEKAWTYDTGEQGGLQTNPLIVGRTLYAYTPKTEVIALDAVTGTLKWKFDSGIVAGQPARGVTYWNDGQHGRIYAAVMNFLFCLDAETGKLIPSFGENGRIDLRKGLIIPGEKNDFSALSIALTTPGIIYKDMIIVGGREPEAHPAPPGYIQAFDLRTGQLRWVFHTIPLPGEPGYETWPKDAYKTAGAANNWCGMVLDAEHGIVYAPTGSAVMDFYGGDRLGNDLYADSLLALDANTGKRIWSFQGVHHDIWDRDFPSPPALFSVERNGKRVDALAQTTKQGYLYLFNRLTGEPLFPIHEHPYAKSTVPGEVTSPTQPKPDWPEPYARQELNENMLTTRTPEAHEWALKTFRTFRNGGQFYPMVAGGQQTVIFPGFDGGAEWGGPAIDPVHDVIYINETEMVWTGGIGLSTASSPGEALYQSQCAMCHGMDRAGSPPAFPSLVDIQKRMPDDKIISTIHQGLGRMPSFPNLEGERLNAVLEYLHSGAAAPPKELQSAPAAEHSESAQTDSAGAAAYAAHCATCHGDQMEGGSKAPSLVGLGGRLNAAQVTHIIQNGKGKMEPVEVPGPDLVALLRFLRVESTIKKQESNPEEWSNTYIFTGYRKFLDPDGYPAIAPPWGTLNAIDLKTGKYLWKVPLGNYPALAKQGATPKDDWTNTGTENYGGPVITASGVLFIGATVYDHKLRAFDTSTGKVLWQADLPFAGVATPATYMIDGRQYVVIASSNARTPKEPQGAAYVAFALPATTPAPDNKR